LPLCVYEPSIYDRGPLKRALLSIFRLKRKNYGDLRGSRLFLSKTIQVA
jgi:hypothetical protein